MPRKLHSRLLMWAMVSLASAGTKKLWHDKLPGRHANYITRSVSTAVTMLLDFFTANLRAARNIKREILKVFIRIIMGLGCPNLLQNAISVIENPLLKAQKASFKIENCHKEGIFLDTTLKFGYKLCHSFSLPFIHRLFFRMTTLIANQWGKNSIQNSNIIQLPN